MFLAKTITIGSRGAGRANSNAKNLKPAIPGFRIIHPLPPVLMFLHKKPRTKTKKKPKTITITLGTM